ncbi:hypothetical protein H0H93_000747 [Arthromyces matolae]|nr:hypothetical protein H0H93_000747 [Arthromyces matolae]
MPYFYLIHFTDRALQSCLAVMLFFLVPSLVTETPPITLKRCSSSKEREEKTIKTKAGAKGNHSTPSSDLKIPFQRLGASIKTAVAKSKAAIKPTVERRMSLPARRLSMQLVNILHLTPSHDDDKQDSYFSIKDADKQPATNVSVEKVVDTPPDNVPAAQIETPKTQVEGAGKAVVSCLSPKHRPSFRHVARRASAVWENIVHLK